MNKIDPRKELKALYQPSARAVSVVDVPPMRFLMIDGEGDPNTAASYRDAAEALYALSYTLKFMLKKGAAGVDVAVMPLEGLWWTPEGGPPDFTHKERWRWTAMIAQPEVITAAHVAEATQAAAAKRDLPALPLVRLATYTEGRAAQILYTGPYADERPTIERIHAFIRERGGRLTGKHHEIYLSDPRRAAPEKLKTVIRQPFAEDGTADERGER